MPNKGKTRATGSVLAGSRVLVMQAMVHHGCDTKDHCWCPRILRLGPVTKFR